MYGSCHEQRVYVVVVYDWLHVDIGGGYTIARVCLNILVY